MPVGVAVPVVRVRRGPEGVPVCEGVKEGVTTGWIFGHALASSAAKKRDQQCVLLERRGSCRRDTHIITPDIQMSQFVFHTLFGLQVLLRDVPARTI